ncbi:MAG: PepSY domain-containing protein [Ignavibacteria bacterium]|nr:PepSY domain-containing protein [Ignavibacteria bacterium]
MVTNTIRSDVQAAEQSQTQAISGILMRSKQWFKRNAYNLHRWISIAALVPALMWSLSGTSHPFMAHWFKPAIAKEFLPPKPIDQSAVQMPLSEALRANGIAEIRQFHLIALNGKTYYQVQTSPTAENIYLDARTGTRMADGDREYAISLAKQYFGNSAANVTETRFMTQFTDEYRYVNRLLPVWKISFAEGGYDIYVETASGRMGTYNTPLRRAFAIVFLYCHNWGFLNAVEPLRLSVVALALGVIILMALSGIVLYAFLWNKRKQRTVTGLRKYHRSLGIAVSVSTLTFASSGMYHALHKERLRDEIGQPNVQAMFKAEELKFGVREAGFVAPPMYDVSAVRISGEAHYRFAHSVSVDAADECCAPMQNTQADKNGKKPQTIKAATYFNANTGKALPSGDSKYARAIAAELTGISTGIITQERLQTEFQGEYGFINKRLPVQRLDLATPDKRTLYVETATGTLAADVQSGDRLEGFTFAYIHKLEFLKPLGKDIRDGVTVGLGLVNSLMAVLGLVLFVRLPKKK